MKYVVVRCEDVATVAPEVPALLAGAKTAHLQGLSQAGAAGLIRPPSRPGAINRFQVHRGLFGLAAKDPEASAGWCYAASVNLPIASGDTVWCCRLMTQYDGRIVDSTAGHIPSPESRVLIETLNEELGSDTSRWVIGEGPRHIFVTRDPALAAEDPSIDRAPELVRGQMWRRTLPRGPIREPLRRLIEQAAKVLEAHPVNRVRVDLGENPGNLLWFWGATRRSPERSFKDRVGFTGAIVSNRFPMRGFAKALGLTWAEAPVDIDEGDYERLFKNTMKLLKEHDFVYVHLRVHQTNTMDRLCAMERLDRLVLKPLTEALPGLGEWRLLVAVDDRAAGLVPFTAIGTGLPRQPVSRLRGEHLAHSRLSFPDSERLFAWFTQSAAA